MILQVLDSLAKARAQGISKGQKLDKVFLIYPPTGALREAEDEWMRGEDLEIPWQ
jgi:hypothetical protein